MAISVDDVVVNIDRAPSVAALVEAVNRRHCERKGAPRVTYIHVPFADGVYRLMLGRKQIEELETISGYADSKGERQALGIGAIYGRMARGRAFLPHGEADWANMSVGEALASEIIERDVVNTIRLALIGGGEALVDGSRVPVSPARAKQLVDVYVVGQPLEDGWTLAFAVLAALVSGVEPNGFGDEVEPPEAEAA